MRDGTRLEPASGGATGAGAGRQSMSNTLLQNNGRSKLAPNAHKSVMPIER
jgi:hypothetical protein